MRVVSDSELLVMFVTSDGEGTASNISEWHKIMGKRCDGWKRKITARICLTEYFMGKYNEAGFEQRT